MQVNAFAHHSEKEVLTYSGIHKWIVRIAGKPMRCEVCGDDSDREYQWADLTGNLGGRFAKNRDDWKRMCIPCHKRHDLERLGDRKKPKTLKTHCKSGHELAGDNLYMRPNGYHDCRACRNASAKRFKLSKELS